MEYRINKIKNTTEIHYFYSAVYLLSVLSKYKMTIFLIIGRSINF